MLLQTDSLRVQHTKVALTLTFSERMTYEVIMLQLYELQNSRPSETIKIAICCQS